MPESPAVTGRIDMDKEISLVRLKALGELYEAECAAGSYWRALRIAAPLRILSPANPVLPARPDAHMVENLADRKISEEWYQFSEEATQMRLAFPAYLPEIPKGAWVHVESLWRANPPFSTPFENTVALAYRTRIVFPDSKTSVTDADLTKMNELISVLRQQKMLDQYLAYCAERRILFPDQKFEYTDSDREFMCDALRPSITLEEFAERAANVKIISAADVRMTTSGLRIIKNLADIDGRNQKLPEQLAI